jgi:glycolate oxidase iron-sulfur subunit
VTVKEYGHLLAPDTAYAAKARHVAELTRDVSELLPDIVQALRGKVDVPAGTVAYHPPCTLQHGQKLRGGVEAGLRELGFDVRLPMNESHLCCGSAGTYSVLHADIAHELRDRKLGHLSQLQPSAIVSANIGCITHLQSGTATPVRHWIELLDSTLPSS